MKCLVRENLTCVHRTGSPEQAGPSDSVFLAPLCGLCWAERREGEANSGVWGSDFPRQPWKRSGVFSFVCLIFFIYLFICVMLGDGAQGLEQVKQILLPMNLRNKKNLVPFGPWVLQKVSSCLAEEAFGLKHAPHHGPSLLAFSLHPLCFQIQGPTA